MIWCLILPAIAFVLVALIMLGWSHEKARLQRMYDEKVGLDLEGLIALLPARLRGRRYFQYMLAPDNGSSVRVALLFKVDELMKVMPPLVGLEFDRDTGKLVGIRDGGLAAR